MVEEVAAQVADHPLAQPGDEVEARARGDRQHDRDSQQGGQGVVQDVGAPLGESAVDQGAQAGAEGQHRPGRDQQRQQRQDRPAAIGPQIGPQQGQAAKPVHGACQFKSTPSSSPSAANKSPPPRVSSHWPAAASNA